MSNGPIEFSDLVAKRLRTVEIPVTATDSIAVHWSPDKMTPPVLAMMEAMKSEYEEAEKKDPFANIIAPIMALVASWDIQLNGAMYPIEPDPIRALGISLGRAIADAIGNDFLVSMNAEGLADTKGSSVSPLETQPSPSSAMTENSDPT